MPLKHRAAPAGGAALISLGLMARTASGSAEGQRPYQDAVKDKLEELHDDLSDGSSAGRPYTVGAGDARTGSATISTAARPRPSPDAAVR